MIIGDAGKHLTTTFKGLDLHNESLDSASHYLREIAYLDLGMTPAIAQLLRRDLAVILVVVLPRRWVGMAVARADITSPLLEWVCFA